MHQVDYKCTHVVQMSASGHKKSAIYERYVPISGF